MEATGAPTISVDPKDNPYNISNMKAAKQPSKMAKPAAVHYGSHTVDTKAPPGGWNEGSPHPKYTNGWNISKNGNPWQITTKGDYIVICKCPNREGYKIHLRPVWLTDSDPMIFASDAEIVYTPEQIKDFIENKLAEFDMERLSQLQSRGML